MLAEGNSYKLTSQIVEPMRRVCVCCTRAFDENQLIFEQRLIGDESFCSHCFADIMNNTEYSSDMRYQEYM
jgi:hypothetical protein